MKFAFRKRLILKGATLIVFGVGKGQKAAEKRQA
jgi:hypothetical protein